MAEQFVVFAHGMANFSHNRGTASEQASLLREVLGDRHELLGIFDDSGNFVVTSARGRRPFAGTSSRG